MVEKGWGWRFFDSYANVEHLSILKSHTLVCDIMLLRDDSPDLSHWLLDTANMRRCVCKQNSKSVCIGLLMDFALFAIEGKHISAVCVRSKSR